MIILVIITKPWGGRVSNSEKMGLPGLLYIANSWGDRLLTVTKSKGSITITYYILSPNYITKTKSS